MQSKDFLDQIELKRKASLKKIQNQESFEQYIKENHIKSGFHYDIESLIEDTKKILGDEMPVWNRHLWLQRKRQIDKLSSALNESYISNLGYDEDHLLSVCFFIEKDSDTDFFYSKYNAFVYRLRSILKRLTPQQIHCNSQVNYLALKKIHHFDKLEEQTEFVKRKWLEENKNELTKKLDHVTDQKKLTSIKTELIAIYENEVINDWINKKIEEQQKIVMQEYFAEVEKKINEKSRILNELGSSYTVLSNQFALALSLLDKIAEANPELYKKLSDGFKGLDFNPMKEEKSNEMSSAQILAKRGLSLSSQETSSQTTVPNTVENQEEKEVNEFMEISLN